MRYLAILAGLTILSVGPIASNTLLDGEDTFTFTNNTGQAVNDLHIDWSRAVKVKSDTPFVKTSGSGTNKTDHSKGAVAAGATASVTVTWDGSDPKVKKWWWTEDGKQVGRAHTGNPTMASTGSSWGLDTATFVTAYGTVVVNLPDDAAAGDTISGTVVPQPSGDTPDEIQRNMDVLSGYVVEVGNTETSGGGGTFALILPWVTPVMYIALKDQSGKTVGTAQIPADPTPRPGHTGQPTPGDYDLPEYGQAGKPFEVAGPFGSKIGSTDLTIGGEKVPPVAKSPRKAVFICPQGASGATQVELTENGVTASGDFNRLNVQLSAGKLSLMSGESTTVTATVEGLQGLSAEAFPVEMHMVNYSPGIVSFNGAVLTHAITASEVSSAGTFTLMVTLTGLTPGPYTIGCDVGEFSSRCGAQTHVLLISRISKTRKGRQYCVTWTEKCNLGTCRLNSGHAGDHAYVYKKCGTHADIPHEDCYATKGARDAQYRKLQKEKKKRESDAGY